METTIGYGGYIEIVEKGMDTTIVQYSILGLYWDNEKENGNYYLGFRLRSQVVQHVLHLPALAPGLDARLELASILLYDPKS